MGNPVLQPSEPLRGERERMAQLLAIGFGCDDAAYEAGMRVRAGERKGDRILPGNAARIAREKAVRARVAFLRGDEAAIVRETRSFARDRLMRAASLDILKRFGVVETYQREDGKTLGRLIGIDWKAVQESEASIAISSFRFDGKTGNLTDFSRDDALNAVSQLRDMYGLKSPSKVEATGKDGVPLIPEYSDEDRARALAVFLAKNGVTAAA